MHQILVPLTLVVSVFTPSIGSESVDEIILKLSLVNGPIVEDHLALSMLLAVLVLSLIARPLRVHFLAVAMLLVVFPVALIILFESAIPVYTAPLIFL